MARQQPSYDRNPNARLNALMEAFAEELAKRTGIRFYVASGERLLSEQAYILKQNIDNFGKGYLAGLYGERYASAVGGAYPDVSKMEAAIRAFGVSRGTHLAGEAIDVRNSNLTPDQQRKVTSAALDMGAKVIVEVTPPHLHIANLHLWSQLPAKKMGIGAGITVVLLALGIGFGMWWRRRKT